MNRIEKKFGELKTRKKAAFIAFLTAGVPNLKATEELVVSFAQSGVDIVELGVPFSDPLADGPTIQLASQQALQKGCTVKKILKTVAAIRKRCDVPIALMTYYNPVFAYGETAFIADAKKAGVDGVIIPDLPPEEASVLIAAARRYDVSTVFFVSPTTTTSRANRTVAKTTGFVYYVSVAGVTGARTKISHAIGPKVKAVKKLTDLPVCVGFGVSTPTQVAEIAAVADGVIVGSAIVSAVMQNTGKKDMVARVSALVKKLAAATE